jgi:hypothetical protein
LGKVFFDRDSFYVEEIPLLTANAIDDVWPGALENMRLLAGVISGGFERSHIMPMDS